jgi:hypothetical protein
MARSRASQGDEIENEVIMPDEEETVVTPAQVDVRSPAVAGTQIGGVAGAARPGATAQGTDYGNPYDENTPPYSVYKDPSAASAKAAERKQKKASEERESAGGSLYTFDGAKAQGDETSVLVLADGTTVEQGVPTMLTAEEVEQLTDLGYKFSEAEEEEVS